MNFKFVKKPKLKKIPKRRKKMTAQAAQNWLEKKAQIEAENARMLREAEEADALMHTAMGMHKAIIKTQKTNYRKALTRHRRHKLKRRGHSVNAEILYRQQMALARKEEDLARKEKELAFSIRSAMGKDMLKRKPRSRRKQK